MGIMILSIVMSMVLGCVTWLLIGNKFPLNPDLEKFPALNNIVIYFLALLVPVYSLIFLIFS